MKILNVTPVPAVEARKNLQKRPVKQLSYEQKICRDFLNKHFKFGVLDVRKMVEELQTIRGVRDTHAVMLANLRPKDKDDVRLVFAKEKLLLGERLDKILEIVKKYMK
jgi:DNA-directed RNA polymerase subunit F